MNKKALFLLAIVISCLVSCTSKKNRIVADTLTIVVDPAGLTVSTGTAHALKAICKSAKSDNVDVSPGWTVDPAALGTFSPLSGKSATFTASQMVGTGKISAEYSGVKGSINVTVSSNAASSGGGGGGGGGGTLKHIIFSDATADTDLQQDASFNIIMHLFDFGNAAPWQMIPSDGFPGCPVDSIKCIRLDYVNQASSWGGFYVSYSTSPSLVPKNFSSYTYFSFYVKGNVGGEKFTIGMKDSVGVSYEPKVSDYLSGGVTTSWQKVSIPIADFGTHGVNTTSIIYPLIVACTDAVTGANAIVFIDYIGFE